MAEARDVRHARPSSEADARPSVPRRRPLSALTQPSDPLTPYQLRALVIDGLGILACLGVGSAVAWWAIGAEASVEGPELATMAVLGLGWMLVLILRGVYDTRILGVGGEEFKRVVAATVWVVALVAVIAFVARIDPGRGLVLVALPLGMLLLPFDRWLLRLWLLRRRLSGRDQHRTLVIGPPPAAEALFRAFAEDRAHAYVVVTTVDAPGPGPEHLDAWLDAVMSHVTDEGCHAVAVAQAPTVSSEVVRRLAWRLEGPRIDLLVAPSLGDSTGPRLDVRPAPGLPLVHLDEPRLTGPARATKRLLDLALALPILLLLSPIMILSALAIRASSRGRVFYTQERVGQGGETFRFLKFRTMVQGADRLRAEVIGVPDDGITDRYRNDPRITPVGRVLRRWSLDELPQLLNVIGGSMSIVGPRPVLVEELPLLADADHRRHLTKPGLTGLWQISGRKEVDWEERMRLDLYYVENWSPTLDFVILARTAKAVISGRGAY